MKKHPILMFICLIFLGSSLQGQSTDSLLLVHRQRIEKLEQKVMAMHGDVLNFNRQYSTGTSVFLGGVVLSSAGLVASLAKPDYHYQQGAENSTILLIVGSAMSIAGLIIQIDAHKYLGGKSSAFIRQGRVGVRVRL